MFLGKKILWFVILTSRGWFGSSFVVHNWDGEKAVTRVTPEQVHSSLTCRLQLCASEDDDTNFTSENPTKQDNHQPTPDWLTAEFTLRNNLPKTPSPELDPETVALLCCRNLQFVDYPTELDGLRRCFPFFTFECRKAVTARMGGSDIDRFCQHGKLSPALQPFMGALRVDLGPATNTPAQPPYRGALTSFGVTIHGASILALQHLSGLERGGVTERPPETQMVIRLEQQRRPPLSGCWLVREVLDVRHAFAGDMGNAHVGG